MCISPKYQAISKIFSFLQTFNPNLIFYIYVSKDYDATILIYYQYYASVQLASDFIMTDPMTDSGNFMALF